MTEDLYFIPIIARALQASDPRAAMRDAFLEIERLGQQPQYERGFRQFQAFMLAAAREVRRQEVEEQQAVRSLMADLATETFEGDAADRKALLDFIRSHPEWNEEYQTLCAQVAADLGEPVLPVIEIYRSETLAGTISIAAVPGRGTVGDIIPGSYTVMLSTGVELWRGELTETELIWAHAFPGRPLDLAADTGDTAPMPSVEAVSLDGEIVLRVLPGIERGRIEVEVRAPGAS